MNQFTQKALLHLTGKVSLDEVKEEELEHVTAKYPYFTVPQILLAAKYKHEKDLRYTTQLQKAALYAHDAWWLHYQLNVEEEDAAGTNTETPGEVKPELSEKIVPMSVVNEQLPVMEQNKGIVPPADRKRVVLTDGDDNIAPVELLHTDTTLPAEEPALQHTEPATEPADETVSEQEQEVKKEDIIAAEPMPAIREERDPRFDEEWQEPRVDTELESTFSESEERREIQENEVVTTVTDEPITEEFSLEEIEESKKLSEQTLSEVDPNADKEIFTLPSENPPDQLPGQRDGWQGGLEELPHSSAVSAESRLEEPQGSAADKLPEEVPITTEFSQEELDESSDLAHEVLAETPEENKTITVDIAEPLNGENLNGHPEKDATEEFAVPPLAPEDAERNDQMLKNIQTVLETSKTSENLADNEPLVPIDPYHTVDYFASQGIKLVLENEPTDKLGKKLKKFTHWLRQMKKLGPEDAMDTQEERDAEATVIKIADFSNTQREVITEAMAEVLEKQGKIEKAVQIYIKLSFLEPDKSAYFADKIKILKGLK